MLRIRCVFRIPDPTFFHPGSPIEGHRIPDPGSRSASKNYVFLTQKIVSKLSEIWSGCSSRIRILIFKPSRIQGPKRHRIPDPDPQHWMQVKNSSNSRTGDFQTPKGASNPQGPFSFYPKGLIATLRNPYTAILTNSDSRKSAKKPHHRTISFNCSRSTRNIHDPDAYDNLNGIPSEVIFGYR